MSSPSNFIGTSSPGFDYGGETQPFQCVLEAEEANAHAHAHALHHSATNVFDPASPSLTQRMEDYEKEQIRQIEEETEETFPPRHEENMIDLRREATYHRTRAEVSQRKLRETEREAAEWKLRCTSAHKEAEALQSKFEVMKKQKADMFARLQENHEKILAKNEARAERKIQELTEEKKKKDDMIDYYEELIEELRAKNAASQAKRSCTPPPLPPAASVSPPTNVVESEEEAEEEAVVTPKKTPKKTPKSQKKKSPKSQKKKSPKKSSGKKKKPARPPEPEEDASDRDDDGDSPMFSEEVLETAPSIMSSFHTTPHLSFQRDLWGPVWSLLSSRPHKWGYVSSRSSLGDWWFVPPSSNGVKHGKDGTDYFTSEAAVIARLCQQLAQEGSLDRPVWHSMQAVCVEEGRVHMGDFPSLEETPAATNATPATPDPGQHEHSIDLTLEDDVEEPNDGEPDAPSSSTEEEDAEEEDAPSIRVGNFFTAAARRACLRVLRRLSRNTRNIKFASVWIEIWKIIRHPSNGPYKWTYRANSGLGSPWLFFAHDGTSFDDEQSIMTALMDELRSEHADAVDDTMERLALKLWARSERPEDSSGSEDSESEEEDVPPVLAGKFFTAASLRKSLRVMKRLSRSSRHSQNLKFGFVWKEIWKIIRHGSNGPYKWTYRANSGLGNPWLFFAHDGTSFADEQTIMRALMDELRSAHGAAVDGRMERMAQKLWAKTESQQEEQGENPDTTTPTTRSLRKRRRRLQSRKALESEETEELETTRHAKKPSTQSFDQNVVRKNKKRRLIEYTDEEASEQDSVQREKKRRTTLPKKLDMKPPSRRVEGICEEPIYEGMDEDDVIDVEEENNDTAADQEEVMGATTETKEAPQYSQNTLQGAEGILSLIHGNDKENEKNSDNDTEKDTPNNSSAEDSQLDNLPISHLASPEATRKKTMSAMSTVKRHNKKIHEDTSKLSVEWASDIQKPVPSPMPPRGRGFGRGADVNLPAWMAKQQLQTGVASSFRPPAQASLDKNEDSAPYIYATAGGLKDLVQLRQKFRREREKEEEARILKKKKSITPSRSSSVSLFHLSQSPLDDRVDNQTSSSDFGGNLSHKPLLSNFRFIASGALPSRIDSLILQMGGEIISYKSLLDQNLSDLIESNNVYFLSEPSCRRRPKYIFSASAGLPLLHYQWVEEVWKSGEVPEKEKGEELLSGMRLPTGLSSKNGVFRLQDPKTFWKPRSWSKGCTLAVAIPTADAEKEWVRILQAGGAAVVSSFSDQRADRMDAIVVDSLQLPPHVLAKSPAMSKQLGRLQREYPEAPLVDLSWVIQCIIRRKRLAFDSEKQFLIENTKTVKKNEPVPIYALKIKKDVKGHSIDVRFEIGDIVTINVGKEPNGTETQKCVRILSMEMIGKKKKVTVQVLERAGEKGLVDGGNRTELTIDDNQLMNHLVLFSAKDFDTVKKYYGGEEEGFRTIYRQLKKKR